MADTLTPSQVRTLHSLLPRCSHLALYTFDFFSPISLILAALRHPAAGVVRPVAFMPYRMNGQYIFEGLCGGFMYTLGGERAGRYSFL